MNGRSRLQIDRGSCEWTEQVENGRSRLRIDRAGCEWTEQAVNGRSRLRMDGEGCRWAEEAANISRVNSPQGSQGPPAAAAGPCSGRHDPQSATCHAT